VRELRFPCLEWQADAFESGKKEVVVIGGVGSGKSIWGADQLIEFGCEYPLARIYYMGATYPAMRDGTTETICQRLDDYGFRYDLKSSDLNITVESGPARGARFIPTSSEVFRRLKGQMIDFIWCDEAQEWCEGSDRKGGLAYDFVFTRLRQSESAQKHYPGLKPRLKLTANPPHHTSHWLYQKFVLRSVVDRDFFHVTTFDNHLLPDRDEYIEQLRERMDPALFKIEVLGEWGDLGIGRVYYGFDSNRHVSDRVELDPAVPLVLTHDFGVDPRVAVIAQLKRGEPPDYQDQVVHVIDEIRIRNGSTFELIAEFTRRFPAEKYPVVFMYGDPAGQSRNSTTGVSDWAMLQNDARIRRYRATFNQRQDAPLVVDRVAAVNAKLVNENQKVGVLIHPRCRYTIEDFQQTRWKEGTRQLDHGSPSKGILLTHLSDALGYFIEREWPLVLSNTVRKIGQGTTVR
jgi:phage terminase large subunit